MFRRFVKRSKWFFIGLIVIALSVQAVIYYGIHTIYQIELKREDENAKDQLWFAQRVIKEFFSLARSDLFFLKDLPSVMGYINSDFDPTYGNKVEEVFYTFAKENKQYHQIRIINSSGYEVMIDNKRDGTTVVIPQSELQDKRNRYYFEETMELDKNQIYISPMNFSVENSKIEDPHVPVVRLSAPLYNSKNEKKGIIILNLYLSNLLDFFPGNIFLQTEEGNLISLNSEGIISFSKSRYNFSNTSNTLKISDTKTIYYTTMRFLPYKLIVGVYQDTSRLKGMVNKAMILEVMISSLLFSMMLIISRIYFSNFKETITNEKNIRFSLARLTEWRDWETGQHIQRTSRYAVILAKELSKHKEYKKIITKEFIDDIYEAAPLHDIGKVGIRDEILLKRGKLTEEEYEEIKKHVLIGSKVIQSILDRSLAKPSSLIMAKNICEYHHEKYNGKGYLKGLKGKEIPLEARIFSLCDTYDAIRSNRPYKGSLSHEEAIKRIKFDTGKHFDPDIVNAFLNCEKKFLEINLTYSEDRITTCIMNKRYDNTPTYTE